MERSRLGRSGLTVPRVCLGTNNFGVGPLNQETANKIMTRALDLGIDMFDTSDMYGNGESEKIIGQFIKNRRDDVIIATKAGREADYNRDVPPNKTSVSRKNIVYRLEQSLKKLQTDYVDVFYVHKYDPEIPLEETMTTIDSLVEQGKIRYVACSNYTSEQLAESRRTADRLGLENFIAVQNKYNIFDREMEDNVIPYCLGNGVGTLAYSPLGQGFIAGRYERGKPPPPGSRATYRPSMLNKLNDETNFRRLDKIKDVAVRTGVSVPALSVAWILREGRLTTAVVGASKPEQLDDSATAADIKLASETIAELNEL
jgi:1-deoxyxylulose-5-phosphate synthase